jgi:murein DD-endopeptidase MepM/ murein hydrolase activator NlpD
MTLYESAAVTAPKGIPNTYDTAVYSTPGSPFLSPVPGAPVVAGDNLFGAPRTGHTHQGWDLNAPGWAGQASFGAGTPIRAAAAGTIRYSRSTNGGYILHVVHTNGWVTKYMHLGTRDEQILPYAVQDGAKVAAGQVIGYMGNTGNAAGVHLHFEIWHNDQPVDPSRVGLDVTATYPTAKTPLDQYTVGELPETSGLPQGYPTVAAPRSPRDRAAGILAASLSMMSHATARRAGNERRLTMEEVLDQRTSLIPTPETMAGREAGGD